ncbi:O-antigen ligase family protein [Cellulophaga lytica]|nr:O-antigen ligase family protein [Cellulophaga lytica]WQG76640.1 O-antigen ligase family protein [Cellulophaga lytica]
MASRLKNIYLISIFLVLISLPLSMRFNNFVLGFSVLLFIIRYFKDKNFFQPKRVLNINTMLVVSLCLIEVLGLLNTENLGKGIKEIESSLSFLFIPLLFLSNDFNDKKNIEYCYFSIIIGSTLLVLISWVCIGMSFIAKYDFSITYLFSNEYTYIGLAKYVGAHPSYLSLIIIFSIGLLFPVNDRNYKRRNVRIGLVCIHIIFLFQLLSRAAILYFIFVALLFLFKKRLWKHLALISLVFTFITYHGYRNEYTKNRIDSFVSIFKEDTKSWRFERMKLMFEIFEENPIIGVGTGDISNFRKDKYLDNKHFFAADKNYNAHNQLLEYLTTFGVIGGVLYFSIFFNFFYRCYKLKLWVYMFVLGAIFIISFTESIFERYMGVEFFAIITSLIVIKTLENNND